MLPNNSFYPIEVIGDGLLALGISQVIEGNIEVKPETRKEYLDKAIEYFDSILDHKQTQRPFLETTDYFREHLSLNPSFQTLSFRDYFNKLKNYKETLISLRDKNEADPAIRRELSDYFTKLSTSKHSYLMGLKLRDHLKVL